MDDNHISYNSTKEGIYNDDGQRGRWIFGPIVQLVFGLATTISSSIVIACIASNRKLNQTYAYWFIANLSMGDIITGNAHIITFIFMLAQHLEPGKIFQINSGIPCLVISMIFIFTRLHTSFSLLAVAVERYITITRPFSYYYMITSRSCVVAMVVIAVICIAFTMSIFIPGMGSQTLMEILSQNFSKTIGSERSIFQVEVPGMIQKNSPAVQGNDSYLKEDNMTQMVEGIKINTEPSCKPKDIVTREFIVIFEGTNVIAILVTLALYFEIFTIAEEHKKRMKAEQGMFQLMFLNRNLKSTTFTLRFFLVTIFFRLPASIINIIVAFYDQLAGGPLQYFFHVMSILQSISNPYLFAYFNKDFKNAMKMICRNQKAVSRLSPLYEWEMPLRLGSRAPIIPRNEWSLEST